MSELIEITDANFEKEVLQDGGPVLVDVSTSWCGPCKVLSPIIEELAGEYDGKVKIGKLDADNNPNTAARFRILSVPTLLYFKDGQLVDMQIGLIPKKELQDKLDTLI